MEPLELARKIVAILEDKIAEDILLLDLKGVSDFTDYFILANGTSERMLTSLSKAVDESVKEETGLNPVFEGQPNSGWVILDYGYVVVHLLSPERRDYYQLEELWQKAKVLLRLK
ncbi:MAG: ribosome silencing factor [Anaerolineaceae bacterium]|nr:ribosome silencing factor [Anaerolineaceae bacterium]